MWVRPPGIVELWDRRQRCSFWLVVSGLQRRFFSNTVSSLLSPIFLSFRQRAWLEIKTRFWYYFELYANHIYCLSYRCYISVFTYQCISCNVPGIFSHQFLCNRLTQPDHFKFTLLRPVKLTIALFEMNQITQRKQCKKNKCRFSGLTKIVFHDHLVWLLFLQLKSLLITLSLRQIFSQRRLYKVVLGPLIIFWESQVIQNLCLRGILERSNEKNIYTYEVCYIMMIGYDISLHVS